MIFSEEFTDSVYTVTLVFFDLSNVNIDFYPFPLSHTRSGEIQTDILSLYCVIDPLTNIFCRMLVNLLIWKYKSHTILLFLMLANISLLKEVVGAFFGFINIPIFTDWCDLIIYANSVRLDLYG